MKITDSCREVLFDLFSKNQADTLIISTKDNTEKGYTMNIDLGTKEMLGRVIQINGVNVSISEEDEEILHDIVFDFDGNQIVVIQESHCCHANGGCGCESDGDCCGSDCGCHCHD